MTAQYILTVLLLVVSHGMEGKDLVFLFEKYIITEHFDEHFRGCPVDIKMYQKPLNELGHHNWTLAAANDSKLSNILSPALHDYISDLVPAVIIRNHNEMGERIGYISEEIFKNENKAVMDFGNKTYAWNLDTIVEKDGKPQELIWSNNGQRVVFTRKESNADLSESALLDEVKPKLEVSFENEQIGQTYSNREFAKWERKIVSYLSENREGLSLPRLGEIFGKPPGFEKLKQAIRLVPCVSVVDFPSRTNAQRCTNVAILRCLMTNEQIAKESPKMDVTWKRKLVSYLSKNREGVSLSTLGEICGKPQGFETLKEAIESVPSVSVVTFPSKTNPNCYINVAILQTDDSTTCCQNQQIPPNETNGSPTSKILDAQQDSNILIPQQHATNQGNTKSRTKEQIHLRLPNTDILKPSLAWTLSPEIEHMWKYLDYGTGEEVIMDKKIEDKLLGDLLTPRQGKASDYESEQKYLKALPKKD